MLTTFQTCISRVSAYRQAEATHYSNGNGDKYQRNKVTPGTLKAISLIKNAFTIAKTNFFHCKKKKKKKKKKTFYRLIALYLRSTSFVLTIESAVVGDLKNAVLI